MKICAYGRVAWCIVMPTCVRTDVQTCALTCLRMARHMRTLVSTLVHAYMHRYSQVCMNVSRKRMPHLSSDLCCVARSLWKQCLVRTRPGFNGHAHVHGHLCNGHTHAHTPVHAPICGDDGLPRRDEPCHRLPDENRTAAHDAVVWSRVASTVSSMTWQRSMQFPESLMSEPAGPTSQIHGLEN